MNNWRAKWRTCWTIRDLVKYSSKSVKWLLMGLLNQSMFSSCCLIRCVALSKRNMMILLVAVFGPFHGEMREEWFACWLILLFLECPWKLIQISLFDSFSNQLIVCFVYFVVTDESVEKRNCSWYAAVIFHKVAPPCIVMVAIDCENFQGLSSRRRILRCGGW